MCENPVQEIVIDFLYETESDEGDKTIHAYALDGRIFLITKPNPAKLAELRKAEAILTKSTKAGHGFKSPRDGTQR